MYLVESVSRYSVLSSLQAQAVDRLGLASAVAQRLKHPITSVDGLKNPDTIYLVSRDCEYLGFIRVGRRKLYFHTIGRLKEFTVLCVLDFFVSNQREGVGTYLFKTMLESERVSVDQLAFDRPSARMRSFLLSRYGVELTMQPNKFGIVIPHFFA
jgi:alpha-tubulin N-acetyltransferase 1